MVAPRHSTRPVVAASPLVLAGAHGRSLALTRRRFRSALTRARFRTTCRVRAGGHALGWACAGGWYPICAGGWYPMAGGIASDHSGTAYWRRFRWGCALSVLQPTFSPHSSPLRPGRPPIRGRYAACDAASTARRSSGGKCADATGWPIGYVAQGVPFRSSGNLTPATSAPGLRTLKPATSAPGLTSRRSSCDARSADARAVPESFGVVQAVRTAHRRLHARRLRCGAEPRRSRRCASDRRGQRPQARGGLCSVVSCGRYPKTAC